MPHNWKKYKLGDLIDVKHGYAFKGEFFSELPTKDVLLSPGNFHIGGGFKSDKFKYYNGVVPPDYILKEGNTIITMTDLSPKGDTLGTTAKIPKGTGVNYLHNQRLGLVILKASNISNDYIYWALRTDDYHNFIVSSATGSTVRHTSPSRIKEFEIELPTFPEQQSIAEILSSLDDKIELNIQTNKTLEEIANTLYKHWFVDFGPFKNGRFVKSELGMIPEGWDVKNLFTICDIKYGTMPKKEKLQNTGYPVYSGYQVVGYYPEFNCEKGDVIVVARGVGGTGDVKRTPDKCYLTNLSIFLKPKKLTLDKKILFYFLKKNGLDYLKTGSAQPQITINDLNAVNVLIPTETIQHSFLIHFDLLLDMIESNSIEIETLKQIRNYILPKLIRGEITVKEATKRIKEVV